MVQVELETNSNNVGVPGGRRWSREEVKSMVKIIKTSGQVSLNGWMFCKYYRDEQVDWVISAIMDTLNNSDDSFRGLLKLKESLKGGNVQILRSKYSTPKILKYSSTAGVNCIYDAESGKCFIPVTASEILDLTWDIKKGRSIDFIMRSYDFYHEAMNREYLERFIDVYSHKELNKLINFICVKSNREGGFVDHGVGVVRNRDVVTHVFLEG